MIFTRKITLYLNEDSVQLEDVADLMPGDEHWVANESYGRFEPVCDCGNPECISKGLAV